MDKKKVFAAMDRIEELLASADHAVKIGAADAQHYIGNARQIAAAVKIMVGT